jgi:hypothetical protein
MPPGLIVGLIKSKKFFSISNIYFFDFNVNNLFIFDLNNKNKTRLHGNSIRIDT